MSRKTHVELIGLTRSYATEGRPAVDNLELAVTEGECLGLLGPSGCGKTTTLRMIAGLVEPSAGSILLRGRDITDRPPWSRNFGLVFQSYALFPHLTVAENIAFGLKLKRLSRGDIAGRVHEALRLVRLEGLGKRRPRDLSGGQQQRVAIARALVVEPELLLFDEPLSNLDARLRMQMRNEIREIRSRTGITTIFVTHDQEEALTLCDRIAVLRDGKLEQVGGPTEVYDHPATRFVAEFIGHSNLVLCDIREDGRKRCAFVGHTSFPCPPSFPPVQKGVMMIRPHLIGLGEAGHAAEGVLTGTIARRTFIGSKLEIEIDCGGMQLVAELRPGSAEDRLALAGSRVALHWPAEKAVVFPA